MVLHAYTELPATTFWGGVETTVVGYAVPLLDRSRELTGVVLIGQSAGAPSAGGQAGWIVEDVGYPKWEAVPSGALYREVADLESRIQSRLGVAATIRVVVPDGAAAVLGQRCSTILFAYASGSPANSPVAGARWTIPGFEPNVIYSGAAALAAARALSHAPLLPGRL
jgi:hypothetical protein